VGTRGSLVHTGLFLLLVLPIKGQEAGNPTLPPPQKEQTAVISGSVVRKEDGAPLKGATVQLRNSEDRDHTMAARTGADGHFELHNLPSGKYRLTVSRNGYATAEFGQKTPNDPGATFTLRAGQKMSDLQFSLVRAAVIGGRILDEDGEPMPNAMVSALRQIYKNGKRQLEPADMSRSDDTGAYRLFGLKPGRYFVSAQPQVWDRVAVDPEFSDTGKQGAERAYGKTYYPGVATANKATSIALKDGEEFISADILMKEVSVYRIRGKVANLVSNRGNRETSLQVQGRGGEVTWEFFGGVPSLKPDGSFEIADMLPGEYTLNAFFGDEGKFYAGQADVDVTNADVNGIIVTIGPGVTVTGRLVWEGKPAFDASSDAMVILEPLESGMFWGGRARIESSGQFNIKDVPPGEFNAGLEGLAKDCYIKETRLGDADVANNTVRITRNSSNTLQFTVSSKGGRIEGLVTNEDNLPVAGAWVVAVPEESKRSIHRLYKSFTTDQYGHYELRGLAPGKYSLYAWERVEENAWEDADFLKAFEDKGETVDMQDDDRKIVELKLIAPKESANKPE